jgi:hypothetical protein
MLIANNPSATTVKRCIGSPLSGLSRRVLLFAIKLPSQGTECHAAMRRAVNFADTPLLSD